jgi:hypothetical protein
MSHDIRDILERLTAVESKLTPTAAKSGLNQQQKSVPQLPALFKPKTQKVLGGDANKKNPMSGYMVGADESAEPTKTALEETMGEIEEDMLSKVKRDLTTYLDRLEKKAHVDADLRDKAVDAVEKGQAEESAEEEIEEDPTPSETGDATDIALAPVSNPVLPECDYPVKTITLEDGTCFECYGDESKGFEIRHKGRSLPSRFDNLDHAQMAVDLFRARRNKQDENQDYIEER